MTTETLDEMFESEAQQRRIDAINGDTPENRERLEKKRLDEKAREYRFLDVERENEDDENEDDEG